VPHRRGRRSESDARCCAAADTQRIHNVRGRHPVFFTRRNLSSNAARVAMANLRQSLT
jgi:hypothetical protein